MKDTRLTLIAVAILTFAASAHADLCAVEGQGGGSSGNRFVDVSRASTVSSGAELVLPADVLGRLTGAPIDDDSLLGVLGHAFDSSQTVVGFDGGPTRAVVELPPAPSSLSLVLSAMISAAGWQLSRSARNMHFGALPGWYHTGCPKQIGHAVPYDFGLIALPLCCFEQPAGERPFLYRVRREQAPLCDAQGFLLLAAPRGPPSLG
ncbi:MAG: hypothetical protein ACE5E5_15195 [Phycisphaerae bacterium]